MKKYFINIILASLLSQYACATPAPESLFVKSHLLSSTLAHYTFSGAGGGINYFQSCFATDSNCSSCLLPLVFTTYSTALPYGTYSISASALANLLQQAQTPANAPDSSYYLKLAVQSMDFNCASDTAYCLGDKDFSSHHLCLTVAYDGTSVTSLTQNDAGTVNFTNNPIKQYMYIASSAEKNSLLSCPLSATGVASNCTLTPRGTSTKFASPQSAAITTIDGTQYVYVAGDGYADGAGTTYSAITQCALGTSGSLNSCIQVTQTDAGYNWINNPGRITIATIGNTQYAYTTDITSDHVTQCTLDPSSVFGSCQDAVSGYNFSGGTPRGMAFFAGAANKFYAYVAVSEGFDRGIQLCSVGTDGLLSDCAVTNATMPWAPYDVQIAYSSDAILPTRHAYVADHDNSALYKCDINNTSGALENCATTPTTSVPSWQPLQISFGVAKNDSNTQLYAYITDDSLPSSLLQCAIQTTGELDSCIALTIAEHTMDSFIGTAIGYTAP